VVARVGTAVERDVTPSQMKRLEQEVNKMEIDVRALELLPAEAVAAGLLPCENKTCQISCGQTCWFTCEITN
jgi:hypothetical protein